MDIEIINNEVPLFDRWLGFERPLDVLHIVFLGAGWSDRDSADVTRGDLEIDDETQGTVADILVLPPFDLAWSQG